MCASQQVQGLFLTASQVSHEQVESVDQIFKQGDKLKVMVLSFDREHGHFNFSTKHLEKTPGDMLRNPQAVYESAEEMAAAARNSLDSLKVSNAQGRALSLYFLK
jgi:small subunit ribosomal protein S1